MTFMSFIQGKTIHGLEEYSASQEVEHTAQVSLGTSELCRALEEELWKWGMIGQEVGDFHKGQEVLFSRGKEVEGCDQCMLVFLDSEAFPVSAGPLRLIFFQFFFLHILRLCYQVYKHIELSYPLDQLTPLLLTNNFFPWYYSLGFFNKIFKNYF